MQKLTSQGQQKINDIAQQYDVSTDAVMTLLQALLNGNGTMAQFNHPELGGGGQWMQGGMTMVGDMFNNRLKALVDGICVELSNLLANQSIATLSNQSQSLGEQQQQQNGNSDATNLFVPSSTGNWWPSELGMATATGAQNNIRYAYFADIRRLAIDIDGQITVFDTLDHQIGGVSQQQGASVTFTSQRGTVDVWSLPIISGAVVPQNPPPADSKTTFQEMDILVTIERLAELKEKNILTEEEFVAKKNDLLNRL